MAREQVLLDIPAEYENNIFGGLDAHLKKIERNLNVDVILRDGSVKVEGNRVTGFNEKVSEAVPGVINGGIYLMKKEVLSMIPDGKKCSLENEIIPELLKQEKPICGIVNEGYFIDIGIPDDYFQFNEDVKNKKIVGENV